MFKKITLLISLGAISLILYGSVCGQKRSETSQRGVEATDREKDGLLGPVRRITVESAKITFKNGEASEGPRVVEVVTTYDVHGNKVDSVAHPVDGITVPGKEQYKYDDKGNLVEMQLRGPDGAILSKETYKYKFDELGNWKQMTTSIAVFQDGKVGEEPVEVTYRTITYFYNQEVAKMTAGVSSRQKAPAPANQTAPTVMKIPQIQSEPVAGAASKTNRAEPDVAAKIDSTSSIATEPSNESLKSTPAAAPANTPAPPPATIVVKHVSEDVLRKAAISLPEPVYPAAAELSRAQGKVNVELIVDEKGTVTNARATSGNALLNEAAEAAARAARFSPASLSQEPARITGILTYSFVLPEKPLAERPAKTASTENKSQPVTAEKNVTVAPPPVSAPASDATAATTAFYNQGVLFLESGKPSEAAEKLKQAVHKDPEFAPAYVKLGIAYSELRQYKDAVAVFKMAIQIKRDIVDAEAYYQLGHSYTGLGKHSDALNAFKQALYITRAESINPEEQKSQRTPAAEELHYMIAMANSNLGRYNEAVKELKQVIAINPQLAEAYFGLAVCYISLGDRVSAERQQKILATLNRSLADKIAQALAGNRILPPGVSEGLLNRRR